ncbi:MAG: hypothetical protein IPK80_01535 [Nannocystis sp.]|nr:hypothetical protein [Nannocystis sp.]
MPAELPGEAPAAAARERLNLWFRSDDGQRLLLDALSAGRVAIQLPEEGALPVLAWLLEAGHGASALDLLDALRPFFARLRFYPRIDRGADAPRPAGAIVRVAAIGEVAAALRTATPQPRFAAMNEARQADHSFPLLQPLASPDRRLRTSARNWSDVAPTPD